MKDELWDMYKSTERGKKMIELFNPDAKELSASVERIFSLEKSFPLEAIKQYSSMSAIWYYNIVCSEYDFEKDPKELYEEIIDTIEISPIKDFKDDQIFFEDIVWIKEMDYRKKCSYMDMLSLNLFYLHPYFKPLLFPTKFNFIQQACEALDIDLPPIPRTKDYRQFLLYYFDICNAFNEFQTKHKLTDAEFCACLYDFSKLLTNNDGDASVLPEPTNVWFTGASKYDVINIEEDGLNESAWACNERTRRGDIIVVYAISPNSCVYAIGRAKTDGFFNPFANYQCGTIFTQGVFTPKISYKTLKEHPYFSQLPIVRKNLQGLNGVELQPNDYSQLLQLISENGGNVNEFPKLFHVENYEEPEIKLEKDVEEKILIPFLNKLGYSSDDYTRQLQQQFGRKEKGIPDFVFFPTKLIKNNYEAPFIIEAKLDMRDSIVQRAKDFRQAFSYAKDMHAKYYALCDKERFALYEYNNTPNADKPLYEHYWANIFTDQNVFLQLKKIIGRENIKAL